MRTKIFLKKLVSISVAVILAATLAGCFDLGGFSDETEYYDTFGDVTLVYAEERDIEIEEYSIQDYFYNKNTGENFAYGDPKDEESDEGKDIPQLSYVYMAIPVKKTLRMESFALYFNALETCALEVYFYVVDELPDDGDFTHIKLLGDPEYQQKLDEDGNLMFEADGKTPLYEQEVDENGNLKKDEFGNPIFKRIKYSDPDDSLIVGKTTTNVKKGEWVSLMMEKWSSGKEIQIEESDYLLLRFINNSGASTKNEPVNFRVTNLLIRAFF